LNGVVDLTKHVTTAEQNLLNPKGINCIRAFPGRGIRVWGARTSSGPVEWKYINVRRIFLTAIRWIEWNMWDIAFEPNDRSLWARIERELTSYFNGQYRRGALKGATARDSFYVKCDDETNSAEYQEQGQVITEIGLATAVPFEFVVVRLILGTTGVQVQGP
jgi:phage tail sheath protein FI